MAPPCPILAGYRLVVPGPCVCFPFKFVQESACRSCVCRNLEILRLRFLTFHAGFLLVFSLQSEAGPRMIMGFTFLWPTFWFSLLPATLTCNSCRNDSILLDPFLGQPFYSFSQWPITGTVLFFYSWASMSLWFFPFGHPRPVC